MHSGYCADGFLFFGSISSLALSCYQLIAALTVLFVVMGCFLDGISTIVLTTSVILPAVQAVGIDPIWFGIYLVIVIETAQITPPVGMNLLTCYVENEGKRTLYQQGPCSTIIGPEYWIDFLTKQVGPWQDGWVFFSGTIGTVSGLVVGEAYEFSIEDSVLGRRISHRYVSSRLVGGLEDY